MFSPVSKKDPKIKALRDARAQLLLTQRRQIQDLRKTLAYASINMADMIQAGHIPLKKIQHPIYFNCIEPLLVEARRMCLYAGFDFIYQTRTPLLKEPNFTEGVVGIHKEATPTMQKCLDAINERPVLNIPVKQPGEQLSAEQPQLAASDNDDSQKASE